MATQTDLAVPRTTLVCAFQRIGAGAKEKKKCYQYWESFPQASLAACQSLFQWEDHTVLLHSVYNDLPSFLSLIGSVAVKVVQYAQ